MLTLAAATRRAPLGILLIAAFCGMIGLGSMAGSIYLILASGNLSLWAGVVALMGPVFLYLAYNLVQLAPWTYMALIVLIVLLFLSSLARIVISPRPLSAFGEILVELAIAFYLTRPGQRRAFAREGPALTE
jgi:hypothetical protein